MLASSSTTLLYASTWWRRPIGGLGSARDPARAWSVSDRLDEPAYSGPPTAIRTPREQRTPRAGPSTKWNGLPSRMPPRPGARSRTRSPGPGLQSAVTSPARLADGEPGTAVHGDDRHESPVPLPV